MAERAEGADKARSVHTMRPLKLEETQSVSASMPADQGQSAWGRNLLGAGYSSLSRLQLAASGGLIQARGCFLPPPKCSQSFAMIEARQPVYEWPARALEKGRKEIAAAESRLDVSTE